MASAESPVLLIVHGGGHSDPAYAQPFLTSLKKLNISAEIGSQPSDGGFPPVGRSMYGDAVYWRNKITSLLDAGKDVVMIMHSIGGIVGTEAAQGLSKAERQKAGLPGGVVHLIYLASYLADEGESTFTFYAPGRGMPTRASFVEAENGTSVADLKPFSDHFYNDLPEVERQHWAEYLKRVPAEWYTQPVTHATWRDIQSTWIFTEKDDIIPVEIQRAMVWDGEQKHGVKFQAFNMDTGHSPFLSRPDELASIVKQAAYVDQSF